MKIRDQESVSLINFDVKKYTIENFDIEKINTQILSEDLNRRILDRTDVKYQDKLLPNTKEIEELKKFLTTIVSNQCNKKMKCDEIWTIVLEKNESVSYHSHKKHFVDNQNDFYSIALYTKVPENSADLIFFVTAFNAFDYCVKISPKEGMLLVFNSAIPHMSTAHISEEKRIVISANFSPENN